MNVRCQIVQFQKENHIHAQSSQIDVLRTGHKRQRNHNENNTQILNCQRNESTFFSLSSVFDE